MIRRLLTASVQLLVARLGPHFRLETVANLSSSIGVQHRRHQGQLTLLESNSAAFWESARAELDILME